MPTFLLGRIMRPYRTITWPDVHHTRTRRLQYMTSYLRFCPLDYSSHCDRSVWNPAHPLRKYVGFALIGIYEHEGGRVDWLLRH